MTLLRFLAVLAIPSCALALDGPVSTQSGTVSGASGDVTVFKGIPYAAPPVGDLRWKPPQPPRKWDGVRAATDYGAVCPQPPILASLYGITFPNQSEDCLTLNVWTSAKKTSERRPVMVWIHGGAYIAGSGTGRTTDGSNLARQGVVLVTLNYRLGAFGFLAHPALTKESPRHASGNYGLLDQIAALEWVHQNIAAFGGDPSNVTIFGESAGAGSVCRLLVSPLSKGLFQRAIAESGSGRTATTLAEAEKAGEKQFGSDLAAMRAKSTDEIMHEAGFKSDFFFGDGMTYDMIVDGWALPDEAQRMFLTGRRHNVPFLTGTNADEGTIFTLRLPIKTVEAYRDYVQTRFRLIAPKLLELYPVAKDADVHDAAARMLTDSSFLTPARIMAAASAASNPHTYVYHFTRVTPLGQSRHLGAYHASEIPYVFGNVAPAQGAYEESDKHLSEVMSAAWVRFAITGDPNGEGLAKWPAYDKAADPYMEFGDVIEPKSHLRAKEIDVFIAMLEGLTKAGK